MKYVLHKSNERGHADHGWLNARHSFSFASWYDPTKVHFGMLRVLNDDIIAAGMGFGMHPHNDMEIITIPLKGSLEHRDNMGNGSVIRRGDVQVMSAGTGVFHSEFNPSAEESTQLFQLWVFPKEKNIAPRYDQRSYPDTVSNSIQTVASGFKRGDELYIHQDAAVSIGRVDAGSELTYSIEKSGNGVYCMVIEGAVEIAGNELSARDAIGVWEVDRFSVHASGTAEVLFIEVPMN